MGHTDLLVFTCITCLGGASHLDKCSNFFFNQKFILKKNKQQNKPMQ